MNRFERRGACPGLSAPMPTGDGMLVRFVPIDSMTLNELRAICGAARRYGNGTIEISARGSLQVRGLSVRSAPGFAQTMVELGIAASDGLSVVTSPLPEDPEIIVDPRPIAAALRQTMAEAPLALAAKVSVVIDGGGRLHLDAVGADVRLRAIESTKSPLLAISLGGNAASATPLGVIAPDAAEKAVLALLRAIAAQGPHVRAAEVVRCVGIEHLRSLIVDRLQPAPPAVTGRPPAEVIASHRLRSGAMAVGIALPFGHIHSDALAAVALVAESYGVHGVRLAPARALLLLGVAAKETDALRHEAARLGFIVGADDARRRIVACAGKPACASGLIAARALAAELAQGLRRVGVTSRPRSSTQAHAEDGTTGQPTPGSAQLIHVSGCAKGCAHPRAAALTVVGTERGCGIVHHGSARAVPSHHVRPECLVREIERIVAQTKEAVDA